MEDLQVLTQTWSGPLVVAMQILLILLVAWLLQRLVRRTVTRIGERYPVPPELLLPLRGGLRWLIMVSALIMVLSAWACPPSAVDRADRFRRGGGGSLLRHLERALNLFCALLIFTVGPFRIGDRVELIDSADKPGVTGRVVAINLLYTTLEETLEDGSPGPLLQVPNSLFFQKAVRRWRGPGFQLQQKTGNNHLWNGSPVLKSGSRS